MITKNEISSLNLSPTKKDFVQIWNELIEVASKITERWDPTSTNESDPGIVLLKVLAGIADKLNYNIDKNILEAFMPTAAQMESMQKLCELVGYDIKYYQSAETTARITYTGEEAIEVAGFGLPIPKFTTLTNADKDITFVTTNRIPLYITNSVPWVEVPCIEGQISQCESTNENNLITLAQLDDNNRYYLPEIQIAENGIFVFNAATVSTSDSAYLTEGTMWERVSNLNVQEPNTRVFKFGYDSFEGRPYIVFPDDIGSLIGEGLFIYFIRTSGLSGNISPRALEILELPSEDVWSGFSAEQFEVVNDNATTNGANIESISAAYNNFKKTIGTFDTLVTCRDYMNKIYSLMDANNSPYVSNILVTDIRNDINKAITLCSFNKYGILYKELPLVGKREDDNTEGPLIDHFNLVLYPFKTFNQVSSDFDKLADKYNKSFTYTEQMNREIEESLAELKTCAHVFKTPSIGDIVAINNYLRLDALIATSAKVTEAEAKDILKNVKVALVNEFNLRKLDFGEEIPFENILATIENADARIKVVSLQEPTLLTTYSVKELIDDNGLTTVASKEYGIASQADIEADIAEDVHKRTIYDVIYDSTEVEDNGKNYNIYHCAKAKEIYDKLVLRNILAGRASLFEYDETFIPNNSEKPYTVTQDITEKVEINFTETTELINSAIDNILESDTPIGEHILFTDEQKTKPLTGLYGGLVTLKVSGGATSGAKNTYTVYETYEYDFANPPLLEAHTCADNDNDHKCDFCDKEMSSHVDEDQNKKCDYCGADYIDTEGCTDHTDTDTDKKCDYCGASLEAGSDDTGDEPTPAIYRLTRAAATSSISNDTSASTKTSTAANGIIKNISKIEATCELESTTDVFANITLAKNEVVKFRAPNLITTQTFPAYVYYNYTKAQASNTEENIKARPAKVQQLNSFINAIGLSSFFTGLWDANKAKLSTFTAHLTDTSDKIAQSVLPNALKSAIVVGLDVPKEAPIKTLIFQNETTVRNFLDSWQSEKKSNGSDTDKVTKIKELINLTQSEETALYNTYLMKKYEEYLATLEAGEAQPTPEQFYETAEVLDKDSYISNYCLTLLLADELIFKYYPLDLSTKDSWGEYIKSRYQNHYLKTLPDEDGVVLWRLSSTYSHIPGKLVTGQGQQLYAQTSDFVAIGNAGEVTYLCTDLGADAKYSTIAQNSDIQLRPGDKLYIHYTPSSVNKDGETVSSEPVSVVYETKPGEDPIIIKPTGFSLVPTKDLVDSQGISWKKTKVDFPGEKEVNLLALGANEQIELRSVAKVKLDKPARFYKNFNHTGLENGTVTEYELKDGEYLFYTDQNAQNAAYYGSGSVITLTNGANLPKASQLTEVSEILNNGLNVVPWSSIVLLNENKCITITEYQYITLVAGDTINQIELLTGKNTINEEWQKCKGASYRLASEESSSELPLIDLDGQGWQVCSLLEMSTAPGLTQTLRAAESLCDTSGTNAVNTSITKTSIKNKLTLYKGTGTAQEPLCVVQPIPTDNPVLTSALTDAEKAAGLKVYEPVSVKLSKSALSASGKFEPTQDKNKSSAVATTAHMKVFKEDAPSIVELTDENEILTPISSKNKLSLDYSSTNVDGYWTKIAPSITLIDDSTGTKLPRALNLNFMIPEELDVFGIFSIYVEETVGVNNTTEEGTRIYIDVPMELGNYSEVISLYNYRDVESIQQTWWPDRAINNRLYLKTGLNCIKVLKSCNLLLKAENDASGYILYDTLKLVKGRSTHGVNLALLDPEASGIGNAVAKTEEEKTALMQAKIDLANKILVEIAKLDQSHEFYYNVPIENSLAMEFDTNNKTSFSNPYTLYDINNVNNNFVISKLDVDYLDTGLKIAKSSKYQGAYIYD